MNIPACLLGEAVCRDIDRSRLPGAWDGRIFTLVDTEAQFSRVMISDYLSICNIGELPILGITWYCLPFDFSCSDGCVEVFRCGFNLYFSED